MRVGIFYFSVNPAPDRSPVHIAGQVVGYVRGEEVEVADLSDGLSKFKDRDDECLMNSHPLDAKDWKD